MESVLKPVVVLNLFNFESNYPVTLTKLIELIRDHASNVALYRDDLCEYFDQLVNKLEWIKQSSEHYQIIADGKTGSYTRILVNLPDLNEAMLFKLTWG